MHEADWVENSAALTQIFGEWPSFHDAEVLMMHLDRAGEDGSTLEARIHVFLMTDEVDERGYYVLTNHTDVTLRFTNIVLRQLHWFNDQNVLSELLISELPAEELSDEQRFHVHFASSWGVEAELLCGRILVHAAEPFTPVQPA
jgi:hypothetical protein